MQIGALIRRAALHFGDAPCLVEGERIVSFREFDALTDRLGNSLLAEGLEPGDRVGVLRPNGIECPHCHSQAKHSYVSTRHIWKCKSCRKQFSPKAGTIFEDSPIGLDRWFTAVWMVANHPERVTPYRLHQTVGVTQTTAQFMLRRIRLAMQAGDFRVSEP